MVSTIKSQQEEPGFKSFLFGVCMFYSRLCGFSLETIQRHEFRLIGLISEYKLTIGVNMSVG